MAVLLVVFLHIKEVLEWSFPELCSISTYTVYENLAFPLKVRKMDKAEIEDRIKRTLDMVSLMNLEIGCQHSYLVDSNNALQLQEP